MFSRPVTLTCCFAVAGLLDMLVTVITDGRVQVLRFVLGPLFGRFHD